MPSQDDTSIRRKIGRTDSYYGLDALRGTAAIAVLMLHAAAMFRPVWMRSSYLAVDLFFSLSGFVIAHAYRARLNNGLSAFAFLKIRIIRIFPLYLLGTTIAVATALVLPVTDGNFWSTTSLVRAILASAFLIPLPPDPLAPNTFAFPLNIPAWSLFFELAVNFAYAAAFRFLTPRRTVILIAAALAGLVITALHFGALQAGAEWESLWGGVPRVAFSFFMGVMIHRLSGGMKRNPRIGPWSPMVTLLLLFAVPVPHSARWVFDLVCVTILFPFLIWYTAGGTPGSRRQRQIFTLLGKISYALYAIHVPLLGVAVVLMARAGAQPQFLAPLTGMVFLALTICASLAADAYFDAPVRRFITIRAGLGRMAHG